MIFSACGKLRRREGRGRGGRKDRCVGVGVCVCGCVCVWVGVCRCAEINILHVSVPVVCVGSFRVPVRQPTRLCSGCGGDMLPRRAKL